MKLKPFRNFVSAAMVVAVMAPAAVAQTGYEPTEENLQAREAFRDSGFGIFIHWGVSSMLGRGEWVLNRDDVTLDEYERLAASFYPSRFDADAWARAFKASGAEYITFTTRHHDGFSMFATEQSPYNIVDGTPYGRDVLKELSQACARHGLKLHLYYSHLDWRRDDYVPLGRTGHDPGRRSDGRWSDYLAFMNAQLTELLTGYGPIGAIWFDGLWDRDEQPGGMDAELWQLPQQYAMIHRLQPACLIGNNHHVTPYAGEDMQIFERDKPGENTAGLSGQAVSALPLETCQTMNDSWGYRITDDNYKSSDELIRYLVGTAGRDANLLLNVGPRPDGTLPEKAVKRLADIGAWMQTYGATVKGVRGGPVAPHEWGVTTHRGRTMYVHVISDSTDDAILLPYTAAKPVKACMYDSREAVPFTVTPAGIVLRLPAAAAAVPDRVVELTFKTNI